MWKTTREEAFVRVSGATQIPAILLRLGADPELVFREAEIDLKLFDDPDNLMPFAARIKLLNLCAIRTGCRHFGLLLGQQSDLPIFGLAGYLAQNSADVETALNNLTRHIHLHVRGATPRLTVFGNQASFAYEVRHSHSQPTEQLVDAAMAMAFNIMRALCGPEWGPTEVSFVHQKPEGIKPFRQFFRCPLRFDAEQNAVVFPTVWLSRSLSNADPALRRLLKKQIDTLEAMHGENFLEQVRSVLRTVLLTDHAKAEQVAALFSMHSRTLNRHLNAYGTSFQKLVDESLFDISKQMLEESAIGVREIAEALDYADASAFTRAFRRWSGTTPAKWRLMLAPPRLQPNGQNGLNADEPRRV